MANLGQVKKRSCKKKHSKFVTICLLLISIIILNNIAKLIQANESDTKQQQRQVRFKRRVKNPNGILPEFSAPIGNVTAVLGRDVRLLCQIENLGQYQVSSRSLQMQSTLFYGKNGFFFRHFHQDAMQFCLRRTENNMQKQLSARFFSRFCSIRIQIDCKHFCNNRNQSECCKSVYPLAIGFKVCIDADCFAFCNLQFAMLKLDD